MAELTDPLTGPWVDTSIQVRYAETDAQGVVYHGNYLVWFEVGRTDYCEKAGYPYPRMESEGISIMVTEVRARYRRSARYGDTVRVSTCCAAVRSRGCAFAYRVFLPDGTLAVEGETQHLFLDARARPCAIPGPIREAFQRFADGR